MLSSLGCPVTEDDSRDRKPRTNSHNGRRPRRRSGGCYLHRGKPKTFPDEEMPSLENYAAVKKEKFRVNGLLHDHDQNRTRGS